MNQTLKTSFRYALRRSVPILVGFFPLGTAYGILMARAGYSFLWSGLASLFVYAGSLQMLMVEFLTAGTPIPTVIVTSLLLNSRHMFYGISFLDKFNAYGPWKYFLIYGLPDYAKETFPPYDLRYAGGRPLFVTVGSMEVRKGQDIFCEAIRRLPPDIRAQASFLFVGKGADKDILARVTALTEDYPENVFYRKRLERPEIKSLMEQCTCVVCASRDDPMPTFVTEGLIFGKPSIVSEHTGTAGLITEGVDGFVYRNDDPDQLAKVLAYAITHTDQLAAMQADCRRLYEEYYTNESFVAKLTRLVEEATSGHTSV